MSTIVTRAGKGSALTYAEVDSNFTNLNTDKYQSGSTASLASLTLSSPLAVTSGGTGTTTSTGSGSVVLATSPSISTPAIVGGTADNLVSISSASGYFLNANTIGISSTISTGFNALSCGPIEVQSGVTVTIQSASYWGIL